VHGAGRGPGQIQPGGQRRKQARERSPANGGRTVILRPIVLIAFTAKGRQGFTAKGRHEFTAKGRQQ
jgi:hypothetical protein